MAIILQLQMLYNSAGWRNFATLKRLFGSVKTTPEQQGFKYLQYAYDHQICCQMYYYNLPKWLGCI
jgi:hypothetical protein